MPILGGCLCFDLPTGSKIIGGIYLFAAIINALALTAVNLILWVLDLLPELIAMLEKEVDKVHEEQPGIGFRFPSEGSGQQDILEYNSTVNDQQLREFIDVIKAHVYGLKVLALVLLVLALLSIVTSSLLVHGVRKSQRGMLVPWILQEIVHIVLALTLVVLVFVVLGAVNVTWALTVPAIVCVFIQVFFIIVVVSQFQALGLIRMHDELCMK